MVGEGHSCLLASIRCSHQLIDRPLWGVGWLVGRECLVKIPPTLYVLVTGTLVIRKVDERSNSAWFAVTVAARAELVLVEDVIAIPQADPKKMSATKRYGVSIFTILEGCGRWERKEDARSLMKASQPFPLATLDLTFL